MAKRAAARAIVERAEVSSDLQEKSLRFLVLKACISRLASEQTEVRHEIDLLMQDEDVKAFDIVFQGDVVGNVKPVCKRDLSFADRTKLASLVSVRQLLELVKLDAKTFDALTKLYEKDKAKLKLLNECVKVTASESTTISKARKSDDLVYAKAAIEKSAQEAQEAVDAMLAALTEGADDPVVKELLEEEEADA